MPARHGGLSVGGVISETLDIYRARATVLLPAAFVVFLIQAVLQGVFAHGALIPFIVVFVVLVVATQFFTGMVVQLVREFREGGRTDNVWALFAAVSDLVGPLIMLGLIVAGAVFLGFLLFIIPGLYLTTVWAVAAPVLIIERLGVVASLSRSQQLVRGDGWQVLAVIVVFLLVVVAAGFLLGSIAATTGTGGQIAAGIIASTLSAPLGALAAGVLYFELRDLRELGGESATRSGLF
jgi:uncharacterized membrane protein